MELYSFALERKIDRYNDQRMPSGSKQGSSSGRKLELVLETKAHLVNSKPFAVPFLLPFIWLLVNLSFCQRTKRGAYVGLNSEK